MPIPFATYILLSLALAIVLGPANAGLDEAHEAYMNKDYATALKELLPLAHKGDARAQLIVGELYRDGQGIPQDYAEAIRWYRRSAEQGFGPAQESLGVLYIAGRGVPIDMNEGINLVRQAANQGIPSAEMRMGLFFQVGRGVLQDSVEAHKWYNLASAHGSEEARHLRDFVAKSMTAAQIAEAQRLAREWMAAH